MNIKEGPGAFGKLIDKMGVLLRDLTEVVDRQTEAVISGDEENIERYTERYTELKSDFEVCEKEFAGNLRRLLAPSREEGDKLKLERLKERWPESADTIEEWKTSLDRQLSTLKRKHEMLNRLLEFALGQNANMMRSLYSLHNQKNTMYGMSGSKEEIASGMAINKEA